MTRIEGSGGRSYTDVIMAFSGITASLSEVAPLAGIKLLSPDYPVPPIVAVDSSQNRCMVLVDVQAVRFSTGKKPVVTNMKNLLAQAAIVVENEKQLAARHFLRSNTSFNFVIDPNSGTFVLASALTGESHPALQNAIVMLQKSGTLDIKLTGHFPLLKGAFEFGTTGKIGTANAALVDDTDPAIADDPERVKGAYYLFGTFLSAMGCPNDAALSDRHSKVPGMSGFIANNGINDLRSLYSITAKTTGK